MLEPTEQRPMNDEYADSWINKLSSLTLRKNTQNSAGFAERSNNRGATLTRGSDKWDSTVSRKLIRQHTFNTYPMKQPDLCYFETLKMTSQA